MNPEKTKMLRILIPLHALVLMLSFNSDSIGQQLGMQTLEQMKQSSGGSGIIELIEHINGQDATTESVLNRLFTDDLIERNGIKVLKSIFEDIRKNDGQWELYECNRVSRLKYTLKAMGTRHGEWLDIGIRIEKEAPYRISAIDGVSITSIGPQAKQPMIVPKVAKQYVRPIPKVDKESIQEFDQWLNHEKDRGRFSGVVLLAKDFEPLYQKAFGLASKRFDVPNTMSTRFRLASANKIFTATAILQLVESGKLSLDDKLVKFVDGFEDDRVNKITIRHLLSHTSGWGAYWEHPEYLKNRQHLRSIDDYMSFIKSISLDFEPGTRSQYSNTAYNVLGAVIEKVTGESYYDFVRQNIFEEAGMVATDSPAIDEIAANLATGYTNMDSTGKKSGKGYMLENIFVSSVKGTPAGGGVSTAPDLLKYLKAVGQKKILNQDSVSFLRRDIGARTKMSPYIFHNGGGPGQSVWVQADMENGYSLIVLSNLDHPVGERVVRKAGEVFRLPVWGN